MSPLILISGTLVGLGLFAVVGQLIPGGPRLDVALGRIHAAGTQEPEPTAVGALVRQIAAAMPWLPVPSADLALLGQDRERWFASKMICGLTGLGVIPVLESRHKVISKAHDDHVTASVPSPPLAGPEVKDVVSVDVPEQR